MRTRSKSTCMGCSPSLTARTGTATASWGWRGGGSAPHAEMAVALIVAAGRGERLGSGRPKALVLLSGRPMVEWSVASLRAVRAVTTVVVALPADALDAAPEG